MKKLRLLILYCPGVKKDAAEVARMKKLAAAVEKAGVVCRRYALYRLDQLESLLLVEKPDIVYSAHMCTVDLDGNHISIHRYLADRHIPYIGSTPEVLDLVISKSRLKEKWCSDEVQTPDWTFVSGESISGFSAESLASRMGFPLIVKPDKEGNSRGLDETSIVFTTGELQRKVEEVAAEFSDVLVEQYLESEDIREYTVAMIGSAERMLLMPARVKLNEPKPHRLITTADKDGHHTSATAIQDESILNAVNAFARRAFESAGVTDYARCDILFSGGKLWAIEINGLPMIPDKWFEMCAKPAGLDSSQYLVAILLASLSRNSKLGVSGWTFPQSLVDFLPEQVIGIIKGGGKSTGN